MSKDCLRIEEEIWESVRGGAELSAATQRHLDECSACSRLLREVEQIHCAMESAKLAPNAPDCRSQIMAKIASRKTVPVWTWAGACAVALTALAVGWAMLSSPHPTPKPGQRESIVKQLPPEQTQDEPSVVQHTEPDEQQAAIAMESPDTDERKLVQTKQPMRRVVADHPHRKPKPVPVVKPREERETTPPAPVVAQEEVVEDPNKPVAIAIVRWPSRLDGDDESLDYSYVQHDANTGETTTCEARRSGNSVEIYMQTTKEDKDSKTIKGSLDDEANRNA